MAKKKVEIPLRAAGDVPSGDVNVSYNGVRIAGLSESTSATLKTEMNVVEHDIEIDYTKSAAGLMTPPTFTMTRSGTNYAGWYFDISPLVNINNNKISSANYNEPNMECYFIPLYALAKSAYVFSLAVSKRQSSDELVVIVNDTIVPYNTFFGGYQITVDLPTYDTPIVISIADKVQ